jgi:hypothetical protein
VDLRHALQGRAQLQDAAAEVPFLHVTVTESVLQSTVYGYVYICSFLPSPLRLGPSVLISIRGSSTSSLLTASLLPPLGSFLVQM